MTVGRTVPPPVEVPVAAAPTSLALEDQALAVMRYLASQCSTRRLIHELVEADVQRWSRMTDEQRRHAFERALRRVGAVCPWVRDKGRVRDAAEALDNLKFAKGASLLCIETSTTFGAKPNAGSE